ncbi:LysR family transcriptional regulator [Streptomyces sp. SA15]|nr:LysR family transcriptional regulator [Streptomyces sp. SA15]
MRQFPREDADMLNPTHLRTFVAVARTLSFTHAAAEVGLQQSTVSEHIRKLETAVGRKLFTRDTHSVQLTADGETLIGFANAILDAEARAMTHFARSGAVSGVLRFGLAEELAETDAPSAIADFLRMNPQTRVELAVRSSRVLEVMLEDEALDLVLGERRPGEDDRKPVWRDRLVWVGHPHTRVDKDEPLPLVLPSHPCSATTRAVEALCARGQRWFRAATSSDVTGLWAAVRAGLGVTVHARSLTPDDLRELAGAVRLPDLGELDFVFKPARCDDMGLAGAFCEALMTRMSGAHRKPGLPSAPDRAMSAYPRRAPGAAGRGCCREAPGEPRQRGEPGTTTGAVRIVPEPHQDSEAQL